jgi:membrane protease subunit HflK
MRTQTIVYAVLGLALLAYLLTGVTQVGPGERAVVRRFGRVLADKPGPGLHVGLPWGMDRVDRVPVALERRVVIGYTDETDDPGTPPSVQLTTGDHNLVNVQAVINYAVDEEHLDDYVVQADRADGLVARAAESVLAEWMAGRTVDQVLISDKLALRRLLVEETQQRIRPYRLGVRIREASIAHLAAPRAVKDAFDDVTRAQTKIRTQVNQSLEKANRQEQDAAARKDGIEQQTAVYVRDQLLRAKVDVTVFEERLKLYEKAGKDKTSFLRLVWWEEIGRTLTQLGEEGRIDVIDHYLTGDGLDLTQMTPVRPKK